MAYLGLLLSKIKWNNQYKVLPNQSQFHELVAEIFRTDNFFRQLKCWQEVNVQELIPSYPSYGHRYDWYIEELNTIIELHGNHHYHVVNFGNEGLDQAKYNFIQIQRRDFEKKNAAEEAGFKFVEIPETLKRGLTGRRLKEFIL